VLSMFNKYLAGGIATIGMIILFILFGIQFFTPDGNYVQVSSPLSWPPSINFCPDFLSLMKIDASGGYVYVCVDTIGVSTGGGSTSSRGLAYFNPNNAITGGGVPTIDQQFNLYLDISNDNDRTNAIIKECKDKGVKFEGIWDGTSSSNNIVPKPPSA